MYTSSWVAPKADVHSQQRFFYMGQKGEINVDQAHRGYTVAKDGDGFRSVNPLFMKYTPTDGERRTGRCDVVCGNLAGGPVVCERGRDGGRERETEKEKKKKQGSS